MNRIMAKTGIFVMLVAILTVGMMTSCRKEAPTVAVIKVVDTSGTIFQNASVRLYPIPTITPHPAITIDDTSKSNIDGLARFDYTDKFNLGQAGFAVLDIEVWFDDTLYGTGIIKIKAEKTSEETVILLPL